MKLLVTILIILGIISCYIERRIQVTAIHVRVKSTEKLNRHEDIQMYRIVWIDAEGVEYDMYCPCPQYKKGDSQTLLITK